MEELMCSQTDIDGPITRHYQTDGEDSMEAVVLQIQPIDQ